MNVEDLEQGIGVDPHGKSNSGYTEEEIPLQTYPFQTEGQLYPSGYYNHEGQEDNFPQSLEDIPPQPQGDFMPQYQGDFLIQPQGDFVPQSQDEAPEHLSSSSDEYVSSNDELDEVEERERIAENLDDPDHLVSLLPSRQFGHAVTTVTTAKKWVSRSTSVRHRGSIHRLKPDYENHEIEDMVDHIMQGTDEVDNSKSLKATVVRKHTIRQLSSNIETKRKVRDQLNRQSANRPKSKSLGVCTAWWYTLTYKLSSSWESFRNWWSSLELWRSTIKQIEGNFGSSVTSYFLLLKWLLYLNIIVFILAFSLVIIPQLVYQPGATAEHPNGFSGWDLLTGGGWFTNTTMYYGFYTNQATQNGYNVPLAYLLTYSFCYLFILFAVTQGISRNYRQYFITGDRKSGYYSAKVFCGWDYGVTSENTAKLKQKSIYLELAETLSLQKKEEDTSFLMAFSLLFLRICTNFFVLVIIGCACFLIVYIYQQSAFETDSQVLSELAVPLLIAGYNLFLPYMFTVITSYEKYKNPRNELYMGLFRVFLMKASVLIVLIVFWLEQVQCTEEQAASATCQCWETFIGQEVYKLVMMDLIVQGLATFLAEFIIGYGKRYYLKNSTLQEFNIARNTMDLIQSQAYTWIGMYFAPLLMLICIAKLIIMFYVKRTTLLYNSRPSLQPWRASLAKTIFLLILLLMFAIGGVTVAICIVQLQPSDECGPFRGLPSPFEVVIQVTEIWQDGRTIISTIVEIISSPGVIVFVIVALLLAIYYFRTVTKGRKQIIKRLKQQIKIEGKDKHFLLKLLQTAAKNRKTIKMKHRQNQQSDTSRQKQNRYVQSKDRKQKAYQNVDLGEGTPGTSSELRVGQEVLLHP